MSNILLPKPALGTPIAKGQLLSKGLVADFPFSDGRGDVLSDFSLEKNHGTITGAEWVGNGLDFDTVEEDFIDLPARTGRFSDPDLTIISKFLVRSTGGGGAGRLIHFASTSTYSEWSSSKFVWRRDAATKGRWWMTNALIDFPSVVTLAITQIGIAAPKFYLDGVSVGVTELNAPAGEPTSLDGRIIRIASNYSSAIRLFDSIIFDFKIYNRALSASEIAALYINPNLPMQQPPIWLFTPPVASSGIIPIIQAHARRRRAG